jgi:hypothetical protein
MVIEHIFLRRASDSIFKFLVFLQQWYPLCRQRDRERLDNMLEYLLVAARHLSSQPAADVLYCLALELYLFFCGHLCAVAPMDLFFFFFAFFLSCT